MNRIERGYTVVGTNPRVKRDLDLLTSNVELIRKFLALKHHTTPENIFFNMKYKVKNRSFRPEI